ncbi:MAG: ferredoxin family protein [Geobacteraceae bacterium]
MKEWRGIPREEINWCPAIDVERCIGCRDCVEFCPNDVLDFDEVLGKARVKNFYNCVVECRACAKICPVDAIAFPDKEEFSSCIKEKLARRGVR